jgi:hypothetical protein
VGGLHGKPKLMFRVPAILIDRRIVFKHGHPGFRSHPAIRDRSQPTIPFFRPGFIKFHPSRPGFPHSRYLLIRQALALG